MNLLEKAHQLSIQARENSHSPYSKFKVGACVKFNKSDKLYAGCNVENAAYPACNCAERVAIGTAIADGAKEKIEFIVVTTGSEEGDFPCGFCLQTIGEFADQNTKVVISSTKKIVQEYKLSELLPKGFDQSHLPS